jgi:hypothetical protein
MTRKYYHNSSRGGVLGVKMAYLSNKEILRRMKLIKALQSKIVSNLHFTELDLKHLVRVRKLDINAHMRYKDNIEALSKFCDSWIEQAKPILIYYSSQSITIQNGDSMFGTTAPLVFDYFATTTSHFSKNKNMKVLRCSNTTEKRNFNYWIKETMKYWNTQISYIKSL